MIFAVRNELWVKLKFLSPNFELKHTYLQFKQTPPDFLPLSLNSSILNRHFLAWPLQLQAERVRRDRRKERIRFGDRPLQELEDLIVSRDSMEINMGQPAAS